MPRTVAGAIGVACLSLCVSCTASPEEQVLTRFFVASRALDRTALNDLATIVFNPRTDGSIQTFSVTNRGVEQRRALTDGERDQAIRSLSAATGQQIDLAGFSVEIISRELTVEATIRGPDGTSMPGMLMMTLERAVATRAGATLDGRWMVTRLQRAPAARTSRGASSAPRS